MIEREKKRIKLEKKYALKRSTLLKKYNTEENFNLKLENPTIFIMIFIYQNQFKSPEKYRVTKN